MVATINTERPAGIHPLVPPDDGKNRIKMDSVIAGDQERIDAARAKVDSDHGMFDNRPWYRRIADAVRRS